MPFRRRRFRRRFHRLFRRFRRPVFRRRLRRFRRHYRRRGMGPVNWRGKWLKGPYGYRDDVDPPLGGDYAAAINGTGQLFGMMSGFPPLYVNNLQSYYDSYRHSQRIKVIKLSFSFAIYWGPNNDGVSRLRVAFFLGRPGLTATDISDFVHTPGPKMRGVQELTEQGAPPAVGAVGGIYRANYLRPFIQKVYYDKTFRRPFLTAGNQQPPQNDYRVTVRLPVRGLNIVYGGYADDYNTPSNHNVYFFVQTDSAVGTTVIRQMWRKVSWLDGKDVVSDAVFQPVPAAEQVLEQVVQAVEDESAVPE